jgi:hypothetical protein
MVIGETLFPHKNCHKVTLISPDYNTENQIHHFIISRTWRSLQNVRNKRGADIGRDHHLVVTLFKLKVLVSQRNIQTCARRFTADFVSRLKSRRSLRLNYKIGTKSSES